MMRVPEPDEELSSRDPDVRDRVTRGSVVGLSLAIAVCLVVVVSVVVLLVVQPGKTPSPTQQSGSLCWDSAMAMEMPCSQSP
jgi:hypothetical protein